MECNHLDEVISREDICAPLKGQLDLNNIGQSAIKPLSAKKSC